MISAARWKKSDAAWLALAVLAHAMLLLAPLQRLHTKAPAAPALSVRLVPPAADLAKRPATDVTAPEDTATADSIPASEPEMVPPRQRGPKSSNEIIENAKSTQKLVTTADLLELARTMHLDSPQTVAGRRLGVPVPYTQPAIWQRGAGAAVFRPSENMFTGMTAPARTEIVDRWLATDRSHNVVVNLPNGQTMCGRAEAWNPLKPLIEPVMMFRTCGGGGKRTFNMTARDSASRTAPGWSNSVD